MCLLGTLCEGTTTLTLERGETTIVPKEVAANVCDVCGEAFMEEEVVEAGAWFDVRRWKRAQKSIA